MADLTPEQLDELEKIDFDDWRMPRLIAMARKALELEAALVSALRLAHHAQRAAGEREIAELKTALKYSSELRIKSAIQFEIQLEAQAKEIAELKRGQSIIAGSHNKMHDELIVAESETEELRAKLAEARKQADDLLDELAPHRRVAWQTTKEPTK